MLQMIGECNVKWALKQFIRAKQQYRWLLCVRMKNGSGVRMKIRMKNHLTVPQRIVYKLGQKPRYIG